MMTLAILASVVLGIRLVARPVFSGMRQSKLRKRYADAIGIAILLAMGAFVPSVSAQTVYHVTENGTGDGSSWSNATSLQDALSSATGDDAVVVAAGRYLPTDDASDRVARFTIDGSQDGLKVYGGWTGSETFADIASVENQLDSRDLDANPTVLSGDIDDNDATNSDGITETSDDVSGSNSYTVLDLNGTTDGPLTTRTVIDGLTVTGGQADARTPDPIRPFSGGGAYCEAIGSGSECSPTLRRVSFIGNTTYANGGGFWGRAKDGGISSPVLHRTVFRENSTESGAGGALHFSLSEGGSATPEITQSKFLDNEAGLGPAVYTSSRGGPITLTLTDVVFANNTTDSQGGALYVSADKYGDTDPASVNLQGVNVLFAENEAGSNEFDLGGAVYLSQGVDATVTSTFVNTTFAGNTSSGSGSAIGNDGGTVKLVNSVVWGNPAGNGTSIYSISRATTEVRTSLVEAGRDGIEGGATVDYDDSNIERRPQFAAINDPAGPDDTLVTEDDGLQLQVSSPATDAGDESALPDGVTTDLLGEDRIQDSNSDGTSAVSLGPYEQAVPGASLRLAAQPASESARFTLGNEGTAGVTGADVDLGLPPGVSVASSTGDGTVSGGTWTVDVPAKDSVSVVVALDHDDANDPSGLFEATAQLDRSSYTVNDDGTDSTPPEDAEATWPLLERPYGSGTALAFSRDDDTYLQADAVSRALADAAFTMEAWVRPNDTASSEEGVLSLHDTDGNPRHVLFYEPSGVNGTSTGRFRYDDPNSGPTSSRDAFDANEWHHIAVVVRGGDSGALYVNGTEEATFTTGTRPAPDGRFTIGQAWNGDTASNFFGGTLDEVRLWNEARTEADIRAAMHQTVPHDQSSLAAYYRFDAAQADKRLDGDFDGSTAYDLARERNAAHVNDLQWTDDSAPLGQESTVVAAGETASIGPDGAQLTANSSGDRTTLYRYGDPSAEVFTDETVPFPDNARTDVVWGAVPAGPDGAADLELTYSAVTVPNPASVGLGERVSPADSWRVRPETPENGSVALAGREASGEFVLYNSSQRIIYVDASASGAENGASWDDAYSDLATALRLAAETDVVVVASGRYLPTDDASDRTARFAIDGGQDGLEVYGGWTGNESFSGPEDVESKLDSRDLEANPTVLSGDIDNNDTTTDGITEQAGDIAGANSHTVLHLDGASNAPITNATVLNGLIITGGQATGDKTRGGGAYCDGQGTEGTCSPTITHTQFVGNRADGEGGALYNNGSDDGTSSPPIEHTTFAGNRAGNNGGALYSDGSDGGMASPSITHTSFTDNRAEKDGSAVYSNGSNGGTSSSTIAHTTFTANEAGNNGGGLFSDARAGGTSQIEISDAVFYDNTAQDLGGAVAGEGESGGTIRLQIDRSRFESNNEAVFVDSRENTTGEVEISESVFKDNQEALDIVWTGNSTGQLEITDAAFDGNTGGAGGAINIIVGSNTAISPSIQNTTFTNNAVTGVAGAVFLRATGTETGEVGTLTPTFTNVLFADNTADLKAGAVFTTTIEGGTVDASFINATFAGNNASNPDESTQGGALIARRFEDPDDPFRRDPGGPSKITLINSILWDNSADSGNATYNDKGTISMSHTLIEGDVNGPNTGGNANDDAGNNLDATPQFADADTPAGADDSLRTVDDGLRLTASSPALNAGNTDALPSGVDTDLLGEARVQDGTVNLGPYERVVYDGPIYHVDADASRTGDGSSFDLAFSDLQDALAAATGDDVIVVASGRYLPTDDATDREARFTINGSQDGLKIYGGWTGTETFADVSDVESQLGSRNLRTNRTVLSGDIGNDDATNSDGVTEAPEDIDGDTDVLDGDNSYTVVYLDGTTGGSITTDTVLDGLTITGGQANSSDGPLGSGGGIYCNGNDFEAESVCSPTLANTTFAGNYAATFGGALYNDSRNGVSSPRIVRTNFKNNATNFSGGAVSNDARDGGTARPHLENVIFADNSADINGGAIYNVATDSGTSSPRITNALFADNDASRGGATFNTAQSGTSSPRITHATFTGNYANRQGGALFNNGNGGVVTPVLTNSILWGNDADTGRKEDGPEIFNQDIASATLRHTLIEGGVNGDGVGGTLNTDDGGNQDADPQFVDASVPSGDDGIFGTDDDGLRLRAGSPALARGTFTPFGSDGVAADLTADLAGRTRIFGARPDLGGYERTEIETTESDVSDADGLLGYLDPSGFGGLVLLRDNAATSGGLTLTRSDTPPTDPGGELPDNVAPFTWTVESELDTPPTYDLILRTSNIEGIGDFSALMIYKSDDGTTWEAVENFSEATVVRDEDRTLIAVQDLQGFSQFAIGSSDASNPLPVELARLDATYDRSGPGEETVTVQWETRSETDNAGFEVQRRASSESMQVPDPDGSTWQTLATVDGAGTTNEPQSYRFEDTDLPYAADSLTYRLRQLDADGDVTLSDAVTVARNVNQAELLPTYPNPTRTQATVRYAVPERQTVRIALYDVLGRRVQTVVDDEAKGRTKHTLDVSDLASGSYFLRMQTDSGYTETQRITVVR